jgi:aspartate/methionine/tyrosine aminotransferase
MFSTRLPSRLAPNALARAVAARRAAGRPFVDLTCSNPTAVALPYPPGLLGALGADAGVRYRPEPRGLADARAAVAAGYGEAAHVDPGLIVLTASTSEAYAWLFKLLCDPGAEVLVPQPSYPLFDLLTRLEGVTARPYHLEYHGAWALDRESVERTTSAATRAVLVVSPNNPTGSCLRAADREWLVTHAASRGLALISDEVFADYPLARRPDATSLLGDTRALTFTLGGLSKSAGLPQVKLGWIVASGPQADVAAALERLDVISDSYLSVSTPVQAAAPALLEAGSAIRRAIHARVRRNLDALRAAVTARPDVTLLDPEGGWSAVLRVPAFATEEAIVLRLLDEAGVLVHPGYFFDFPHEAYLVVSLLPEPAAFDEATGRLLSLVSGAAA